MSNDAKKKALIDKLGTTGSLPDLELKWLEGDNPLISTIPDGWKSYLSSRGFTGSINEAQYNYFRSLGHQGSLPDMIRKFWLGGIPSDFNLADSFSTTLYTGDNTNRDIVTGVDSIGSKVLTWIKCRSIGTKHTLYDTERGATNLVSSDSTAAEVVDGVGLTAFNNDGFSLGVGANSNSFGATYVAWQLKAQEGFFDVVEYVGSGATPQLVPHNAGTFGMVFAKDRDNSNAWGVYHKDLASTSDYLRLDSTSAKMSLANAWDNTDNTNIGLNNAYGINNQLNANYIAYVFAHDPSKGIFCGSYTGTGAAGNKQITTFPVGWLLIKDTDAANNWIVVDVARSPSDPRDKRLIPNTLNIESTSSVGTFDADGFELSTSNDVNGSGREFIYMAIADPAQF